MQNIALKSARDAVQKARVIADESSRSEEQEESENEARGLLTLARG